MNRPLVIGAAVLVPFSLLVVWGLWWSDRPTPTLEVPPAPIVLQAPPPPEPVRRAPLPSPSPPPAPVVVAEPAPPPPSEPELEPAAPREGLELARAMPAAGMPQQLRTAVHQCLDDLRGRVSERVNVTVTWARTDDGTFGSPNVRSSWQDPHLVACVEDAFREMPAGTAPPAARTRTRFTWSPDAPPRGSSRRPGNE